MSSSSSSGIRAIGVLSSSLGSEGSSISTMAALAVYPVGNYTFGAKPPKLEKDPTVVQRMERLKEK